MRACMCVWMCLFVWVLFFCCYFPVVFYIILYLEILLHLLFSSQFITLLMYKYCTFISLSFLCRTQVHCLLLTMTCVDVTQVPTAGMIQLVFQVLHSVHVAVKGNETVIRKG